METIKLAAVAAGILLLAGCGNQAVNNQANENNQMLSQENSGGGIITSIKDAMGLGKTMKCTYKSTVGGKDYETVTYVNGDKYMTESEANGGIQKSVSDGETVYIWMKNDNLGTKFPRACLEELNKNTNQDAQDESAVSNVGQENFDNAVDVKCEPASGIDFSVPSDVTFTDQCEVLKTFLNSDSGATMPSEMPQMPSL